MTRWQEHRFPPMSWKHSRNRWEQVAKGQFEKGVSGNPAGRPRSKEFRELCRGYSLEALEFLVKTMRDKKNKTLGTKAAMELIDRAYGRPAQAMEVQLEDNRPEQATDRTYTGSGSRSAGGSLTNAEKQLGIDPKDGLNEQQRMQRILEGGQPIPPQLYRAWQLWRGTHETPQ